MRLVHTADWHLGKKLLGFDRLEEQAAFVDQLATFVAEEKVDTVLIAGDIFDRSVPPIEALTLFGRFLERMATTGCSVVAIGGNHDSAERLGFAQSLLRRTGIYLQTQVGGAFEPIVLAPRGVNAGHVEVFALPFADPYALATEVQTRQDEPLDPACFKQHGAAMEAYLQCLPLRRSPWRILLAHTFCVGATETPESERPISAGGIGHVSPTVFEGLDYVALGHLHRPQQVAGRPWVRYAGSPLAYSIAEHAHDKSVTLVELAERAGQRRPNVENVSLAAGRPIVVLKDSFEALCTDAKYERHRDSYVAAYYTDAAYVLNASARLGERFPFLLQALAARLAVAETPAIERGAVDSPRALLQSFWSYARVEYALEEAHLSHYERAVDRASTSA